MSQSIRLRLSVRSTRTRSFGWAWVAAATADTGETRKLRAGYAGTWRDALVEGHHALKDIDRQLMIEVHESRSRRRVLDTVNYADDLNAMEMTP